MDEFLCPDCHEFHADPAAPVLGPVARCLDCEIAAESAAPAVSPLSLPVAA